MCCCPGITCILKALLLVLMLLGAAIAGIGIWLKADPEFWTLQFNLDVTQFSTAAWVAIAVGVIIVSIGVLGCCGASKESPCLLSTFLLILVILIILEIVVMAAVWTVVNDKEFNDKISEKIRKGINKRNNNQEIAYFMDVLQSKLECCGVKGPYEYPERSLPRSCTNSKTGMPWDKGCMEVVTQYLKSKAAILGGICIIALLLQIGAMVFTVCLICGIRQAKKQIF